MAAMRRREPDVRAKALAEKVVKFVNLTWGRRLRPSLGLVQAVDEALEAGYEPDQIRAVFWAAACGADDFMKRVLHPREGRGPELALRHKGGTNPDTGKPAVRWLDSLVVTITASSAVRIALRPGLGAVDTVGLDDGGEG